MSFSEIHVNVPSIVQVSSTEQKLEDITSAIVEQLMGSCTECSSDIIDKPSFSCFPESPTHVTYRARLEGTSETDSGSLISLIEQWVRGGASIIVTGVLMTVDSECSVAISSLSEGECSPITPTASPTSGQSFPMAAIGGVVAVVIVLIIAITLAVVAIVALRRRHGNLSVKKGEK